MQQTVCFISDFGLEDTWVGVCHAVILAACPQAHVVDLGHQIPAFDIRKAAAMAAAGVYQLPDAIHLVVVDPGVGGGRRDLCVVSGTGTRLVGPDNGVLIPAARRSGGVAAAYSIDPSKIHHGVPSPTFHARDVLAPAAAALACGVGPESLGTQVDASDLVGAPFPECRMEGDVVLGEVLESDHFGSVRFNITADSLHALDADRRTIELTLGHNRIVASYGRTFSDVAEGQPVALIDSSGWLTLALNTGSAFERYGTEPGLPVHVRVLA